MKTTSALLVATLSLLASSSFADDKPAAVRSVPAGTSKYAEQPGMPTGEKVDLAKATKLEAGGYVDVPAKAPHWARAKTDVVTVRFGNGPGDIMYIDPKDDPRKKWPEPARRP